MVGWLYINDNVAAPVRVLEVDASTGLISLEVAAKFVPNRSALRGQTVVEYRGWKRRRAVRCLGAEQIGSELMIEAVDVGLAEAEEPWDNDTSGRAEDWLVVDGKACCQVIGLRVGAGPGTLSGHCLFRVPLNDWRDLRIGEGALLASVGVDTDDADLSADGSITPMLHAARKRLPGDTQPTIEIIRLRERLRYHITPIATDWGDNSTLVVCRVGSMEELGSTKPSAKTSDQEMPCLEA